ncbi:ATP-binding protein [Thermodesulfobacteriota bacterium]
MNLTIKFFLAFLLVSVAIVTLMIGIMQVTAQRNFANYIHTMEIMRLEEVVAALAGHYREDGGWESLRNNSEQWRELLRPQRFERGRGRFGRPPPPPGFDRPPPPRKFGGAADQDHERRPLRKELEQGRGRGKRPPWKEKGKGHRRGKRPPFGVEHRLTLFDAGKQPVVGRAPSPEGHTLEAIVVDGATVGWLGLRKERRPSQPLDVDFLKRQSRSFYATGAAMVILAAAVALLLSRHLLAPIKKLTAGTRAIAGRDFSMRIRVRARDELGELASDFNDMAATLERYEQMREQWISDIAHELRTPLSVLRGEIEALLDGVRDPSRETLSSLHAETMQLNQIVSDLHDLSLAESGSLHYEKEIIAPAEILRGAVKKFGPRFEARGIAVADGLGAAEALLITGDRGRLTQLFSNLLENTLRYTDAPGALKIWHDCFGTDLMLHIEDSPPGVPDTSLPRLFDRLYRVDASRNRSAGGSGLGLAICKSIVEAHGGTIRAEQSSLGGVRIELVLPGLEKGAEGQSG